MSTRISELLRTSREAIDGGNFGLGTELLADAWIATADSDFETRPFVVSELIQLSRRAASLAEQPQRAILFQAISKPDSNDTTHRARAWMWLMASLDAYALIADWLSDLFAVCGPAGLQAVADPDAERSLIASNRWIELGWMSSDPVEETKRQYMNRNRMANRLPALAGTRAEGEATRLYEFVRMSVAHRYAGCLAAGRASEADAICHIMVQHERGADAYMAMISAALSANKPRLEHRGWLRKLKSDGVVVDSLEQRLLKMLSETNE